MSRTDDAIAAAVADAPIATWEKLLGRVEVDPASGCRLWTGTLNRYGYGVITLKLPAGGYTPVLTHRLAYALHRGMEALPVGKKGPRRHELVLDHRCNQRACLNPLHLRPIPSGLNGARGMANPRMLNLDHWRSDGF